MKDLPPSLLKKLFLLGTLTILLVLISIFFLDLRAAHLQTAEQANRNYRITRDLTDAGEASHFYAIALLSSLISWAVLRFKKDLAAASRQKFLKLKNWGLTFILALLASGVITHLIKMLVGRARPNQSADRFPWNFEPINFHWHYHSFPSGHTQTLFASAVAFSFAFPKYAKWIYLSAAILASTRILLNQHFLSDVLMGAFIGYSVALIIFYRRFSSRDSNH